MFECNADYYLKHVGIHRELGILKSVRICRTLLNSGWSIQVHLTNNTFYDVKTSRGHVRVWKSLDTLTAQLEEQVKILTLEVLS